MALAAWPAFVHRASATADPTAAMTPAPGRQDALIRRQTIAFEERRVGVDRADQITPRMLAAEYLQRYRERGDVGDVYRAERMARLSLQRQPRGNIGGEAALAGALSALHRFREARVSVRSARAWAPDDPTLAMEEASLDLELGETAPARALVARFGGGTTPQSEIIASRLDELSGRLSDGRRMLARAARRADAIYEVPGERRAWFFVRLGEMAFHGGDVDEAVRDERTALARFPDDAKAWSDLGRFLAAAGDWSGARDAASNAVARIPSPENLGLLEDAQAALGDGTGAAATRDEIDAIARIGNADRLVDRLLAVYYADHGRRVEAAYAMARRETAVRDDVYAEDTLAWTAARSGRWDVARRAAARAAAWNIDDPSVWYHLGVIAQHDDRRADARAAFGRALALNARFDPRFADDARARLERLGNS